MVIWFFLFCNNDCVDYEFWDNDIIVMFSNTVVSCFLDLVLKVIKFFLFFCLNYMVIYDVCVYGILFLYFFIF